MQLITKPSSTIILCCWFVWQANAKKTKNNQTFVHCRWSKSLLIGLTAKLLVSLSLTFIPVALQGSENQADMVHTGHSRHGELQPKQPAIPTVCREAGWVGLEVAFPTILLHAEGHICSHPVPLIMPLSLRHGKQGVQVPLSAGSTCCKAGPAMKGDLQAREKSTHSSFALDC